MKLALAHFVRVLASRAGIDRRVRCGNCPHFRPVMKQAVPAVSFTADFGDETVQIERAAARVLMGACALEDAVMASFPRLGSAFYARPEADFCAKHPRHEAVPVEGLGYAPDGEIPPEKVIAGFSRPPALHEARQLDTRLTTGAGLPEEKS